MKLAMGGLSRWGGRFEAAVAKEVPRWMNPSVMTPVTKVILR